VTGAAVVADADLGRSASQTSHFWLDAFDLQEQRLQVHSPSADVLGLDADAPQPVNPVVAGLGTAEPSRGSSHTSHLVLLPFDLQEHSEQIQASPVELEEAGAVDDDEMAPNPANPLVANGSGPKVSEPNVKTGSSDSDMFFTFCCVTIEIPTARLGTFAKDLYTKTGQAAVCIASTSSRADFVLLVCSFSSTGFTAPKIGGILLVIGNRVAERVVGVNLVGIVGLAAACDMTISIASFFLFSNADLAA
jgi:hypothetical protein